MKPTPAATLKCAQSLTGKEVFALTLQRHLDAWQKLPPTFSEGEIARMVAEFDRRPDEGHAYNAWWKMYDMIQHVSTEARRLAMEAAWRISIETDWMLRISQRINRQDESTRNPTPEALARLEKSLTFIQVIIGGFLRWNMLVDVFVTLHGCDVSVMTGRERRILEQSVEHCNWTIECFTDDLTYAACREDKELDTYTLALPNLTMTPPDIPASLADDLKAAIVTCHREREVWKVTEAFDISLYC